jgi:hypothetical protein
MHLWYFMLLYFFLRSTDGFEIFVGPDPASLSLAVSGNLQDARPLGCGLVPLETFYFSDSRSVRVLRFSLTSFFGSGGGLKYLELSKQNNI